jgi:hypothetical protein
MTVGKVLAKEEVPSDKLGLIFKGLLECMAFMGASNCKEETLVCSNGSNSITFYRDRFASSSVYAKLLEDYKKSERCN